MEIKHPEWLQVDVGGANWFGYDQDWYATPFQRTRGCGPTAAAMLLAYRNRREAGPLPYGGDSLGAISSTLEDVWRFVTPNWLLGLNSTKKFCRGVTKLLNCYGVDWQPRRLGVTAFRPRRASLAETAAFVAAGLAADSPVAFLNLHKGGARELESWHWVVLVALEHDPRRQRCLAQCYDGGRMIVFDLGLWLETTKLGGGFVYLA